MGNDNNSKAKIVLLIVLFIAFIAYNIYIAVTHKFSTIETGTYFLMLGGIVGGFFVARAIIRSNRESTWRCVLGVIAGIALFVVSFLLIDTEFAFFIGLIAYIALVIAAFYFFYTRIINE